MSLLSNSPTSLEFEARRRTPEVVVPSKPTPHEFKPLSDVENLDNYKIYIPGLSFYRHIPSKNGIDPVEVIRKAVSEALVFYYPYAGRLREDREGKLVVECTGEGVLFCEADADVTLDQFGYPLAPPFPCLDQLLLEFRGSNEILNVPLMSIQVTRLKCGGFIFGAYYNHTISDAPGLVQFMSAVGKIARGATSPSILPVWERHVLNYKIPQKIEGQTSDSANHVELPALDDLCHKVFFFGPSEINALKAHVPTHLRRCSSFEIVIASIWKCRVVSYQPLPTEEMSLIWSIDLRHKFKDVIPPGYYGNAVAPVIATSTAKEIIENPINYVLQVVMTANKKHTIEDYMRTMKNLTANMWSYIVTDLRHAGFEKVDFGWGEAVFGGPVFSIPGMENYFPFKAKNGEKGMMFPTCLPKQVMERFEKELNNMIKNQGLSEAKSKL